MGTPSSQILVVKRHPCVGILGETVNPMAVAGKMQHEPEHHAVPERKEVLKT